jgi:hypothetical protein
MAANRLAGLIPLMAPAPPDVRGSMSCDPRCLRLKC